MDALGYLHENNIVHRDIKLENILLDSNLEAQIIDFGYAEVREENISDSDAKLEIKGTESYMSPELLNPGIKVPNSSEGGINLKKADVFALGVSLFTMVMGCPPFHSSSKSDSYYRHLFFSKRKENFWKKHASNPKVARISSEFK